MTRKRRLFERERWRAKRWPDCGDSTASVETVGRGRVEGEKREREKKEKKKKRKRRKENSRSGKLTFPLFILVLKSESYVFYVPTFSYELQIKRATYPRTRFNVLFPVVKLNFLVGSTYKKSTFRSLKRKYEFLERKSKSKTVKR